MCVSSLLRSVRVQMLACGSFLALSLAAQAQVGMNWFQFSSEATNRNALAYGAGLFVAASDDKSGDVQYSTDGAAWSTVSAGTSANIRGITRQGSKFYAVGGNEFSSSSDGMVWTPSSPFGPDDVISAIAGSGTTLVAVGDRAGAAVIHRSTNGGTTWTTVIPGAQTLFNVTRAATQYVAVGTLGTILTSPTGVVWTDHSLPPFQSSELRAVASNASIIVAAGVDFNGTPVIFSSPNGVTWTESYLPYLAGEGFTAITWTGSLFVAVGTDNTLLTSADGIDWSPRPLNKGYALRGVAYDGSHELLAVGLGGDAVASDSLPFASFGTPAISVSEGAGHVDVTVTLTAPATTTLAIPVTVGGSAVPVTDFSGVPATVNFAPHESSKTFSITLLNNVILDDEKTIDLTLGTLTGMHVGVTPAQTITLTDDDSPPEIGFIDSGKHVRENEGTVVVSVQLSHPAATTVTAGIDVLTGPGLAVSGTDFSGVPASISFAPGETLKTFPITILDDLTAKPDRDIQLSMSAPVGATVIDTITLHTITIEDNDPESRPGRRWRLRQPLPENGGVGASAYLGSTLVVVGGQGMAMTSTDHGLHWDRHTIGKTNEFFTMVTSAGGKLVAVGGAGSVAVSTDGISWASHPISSVPDLPAFLNDVTWTGTQYVAVGGFYDNFSTRPILFTSPDGNTWTQRYLSVPEGTLYGVAWNGSKFVAVGTHVIYSNSLSSPDTLVSIILTSTDGITWQDNSSALTGVDFYSVLFAGTPGTPTASDRFIAFDGTRSCYTSPDGNVWTPQTNKLGTGTATWGAWDSTAKKVVAVGSAISTSKDPTGTAWTQTSLTAKDNLYHVTFAPGQGFFAVGENHALYVSPAGTAWTKLNTGLGSHAPLRGVTWSGTQFVAVGGGNYYDSSSLSVVMTSPDGTAWTNVPMTAKAELKSVAWSGTTYAAVGARGAIYTSTNGTVWTKRTSPGGTLNLNCVIWAGNQFVAVGGRDYMDNYYDGNLPTGSIILTSPDGVTWTRQTTYGEQPLESITWNGTTFVAVGRVSIFDGFTPVILTTDDATRWAGQNSTSALNNQTLVSVVWDGSQFVAFGDQRGIQHSPDGITWTATAAAVPEGSTITSACWTGQEFIAVSSDGGTLVSDDGENWTSHLTDSFQNMRAITCNGAVAVAVGDQVTIQSSGSGTPVTPVINFAASTSTVDESVGTARILVTMDPAPTTKITIPLSATPASAPTAILPSGMVISGPNADVTLPSPLNIVFNPGETRKFINIKVINDTRDEGDEMLRLVLQTPVTPAGAATIGPRGTHDLIVQDDDAAPAVTITTGANAILPINPPPSGLGIDPTYPLFLQATASGSPPLAYQWTLNGKPIAGATSPTYYLPGVALANAGLYVCTVSNPVAKAVPSSNSVEIGVIEKIMRTVSTSGAADLTITQVGSPNVDFHWYKGGSSAEYVAAAGVAKYSATKNSLTFLKASPFTQGDAYECIPTLKTHSAVNAIGNHFNVDYATVAPKLPDTITLPVGTVGQLYNGSLSQAMDSGPVGTWAVTGLPAGLKLVDDHIIGYPTAAVTATLTIKATNAIGSTSRTAKLVINRVPTPFVGTLIGLLQPDPVNRNLGALVTLTLTKDGRFTGSYVSGNTKQAFTGGQGNASGSQSGGFVSFTAGGKLARLLFAYNESGETLGGGGTLTFTDPPGGSGGGHEVEFTLFRPLTGASITPYVARYNFGIDYAHSIDEMDLPRGFGFGSATVSATGAVTWSGRTCDGSVFTASSVLNFNNTAIFYASQYGGNGSFMAQPLLTLAGTGNVDSLITIGTEALWTKLPDFTIAGQRTYPVGWEKFPMSLKGSRWNLPGAGLNALGLGYTPGYSNVNASLSFNDGGLANDLGSDPTYPDVSVNLKVNGTIEAVPSPSNPRKTTLTVTNATGLFTGAFDMDTTMPNGLPLKRHVLYYGQLQRFMDGSDDPSGMGNFAMPDVPSSTIFPMPLPATTRILSGKVNLTQMTSL